MSAFHIGGCRVEIDDERQRVTTTFPGGATLVAAPQDNDEYVARARSLGYGGSDDEAAWQMCHDHDLLHAALADAHDLQCSPTLHAVAHGYRIAAERANIEEATVLLMQRLANVGVAGVLPAVAATA